MILITGATGTVGANLLYFLLKQNKKVFAIKRGDQNLSFVKKTFTYYTDSADEIFNQVNWIESDLLNPKSLEEIIKDNNIKEIYHCAAMVSFDVKDKDLIFRINVEGTVNLLKLALKYNIEKFCHISSIATLYKEHTTQTNKISEKNLKPNLEYHISNYSSSKILAEQEVFNYSKRGLNVVVVNPSVILSAGNWTTSSGKLFSEAKKGRPFYTNGGTGFVDVIDVCKICCELMNKNIFGERFILNSDNIRYKQLFDEIATNIEAKKSFIKINKSILTIVSYLNKGICFFTKKPNILTEEVINSATGMSYYSNNKIRKTLNWNFITVEDSILKYSKLFLKENLKNKVH